MKASAEGSEKQLIFVSCERGRVRADAGQRGTGG